MWQDSVRRGKNAVIAAYQVGDRNSKEHHNFPAVFGSRSAFVNFSATMEDAGVHAYLAQAGNIKTPAILLTAASIVTVEARHAGAMRALLQRNLTDGAFDQGLTRAQIVGIAGPLIGH